METTIQKLEFYYNQYMNYSSNVLFNINTDTIINRIESLPQCKQIMLDNRVSF